MVGLLPIVAMIGAFLWVGLRAPDYGPRTRRRLLLLIVVIVLLTYLIPDGPVPVMPE